MWEASSSFNDSQLRLGGPFKALPLFQYAPYTLTATPLVLDNPTRLGSALPDLFPGTHDYLVRWIKYVVLILRFGSRNGPTCDL